MLLRALLNIFRYECLTHPTRNEFTSAAAVLLPLRRLVAAMAAPARHLQMLHLKFAVSFVSISLANGFQVRNILLYI